MDSKDAGIKVLKQFEAKRFVESSKKDFFIIEKMALKAFGALTAQGE